MSPPVRPVVVSERVPEKVDVVVVGGGIVGVSAAWFLTKQGLKVALCEKGVVAGEQSSRNWGFCRQQGRDPRELPLAIEALRIWRNLDAEIEERTGFTQTGIMYIAGTKDELAKYEAWIEHAQLYQLDTRLLSPEEIKEVLPDGLNILGHCGRRVMGAPNPQRRRQRSQPPQFATVQLC
jgi:glycine/D-amino acid oxidase-like deaminating enzyme